MNKLVIVLLAFVLSACATSTPYGKYGALGGFTDARIDDNTFSISVDTNGFTTQQTTSMHALYRAAELTAEHGFDHFIIASNAVNSTSMAMAMPRATKYAPTTIVPIAFPNSTIVIKAFKGEKPAGMANAYDARAVMKHLGPQIGIEQGKKP